MRSRTEAKITLACGGKQSGFCVEGEGLRVCLCICLCVRVWACRVCLAHGAGRGGRLHPSAWPCVTGRSQRDAHNTALRCARCAGFGLLYPSHEALHLNGMGDALVKVRCGLAGGPGAWEAELLAGWQAGRRPGRRSLRCRAFRWQAQGGMASMWDWRGRRPGAQWVAGRGASRPCCTWPVPRIESRRHLTIPRQPRHPIPST